ncbi:hypothetical protein C922_03325 [Plasmodium inui San Antonio 1]|uniref:Uncharacterized protein n=1 Tax=Plasmodium inui San Antonio 1 TaxID=1237626 RepID=W7A3A4_9APIC|nr:hypothetical protein C922_03325 [Plasmodium inui San Antonio 1]EUD66130.1 hypothetical protein C922_03325 [Plasmodium inui San Antonio 1]
MLKVFSIAFYLFLFLLNLCSGTKTMGIEAEGDWSDEIPEISHLRKGSLIGHLYVDGWSPIWSIYLEGHTDSPSDMETIVDAVIGNDTGRSNHGGEITKWDCLQSFGDVKKEAPCHRATQQKNTPILDQIDHSNYDKKELQNLKSQKEKEKQREKQKGKTKKENSLLRYEIHSGSAWRGSHFCGCVYDNYLVHCDGPYARKNNQRRGESVSTVRASTPVPVCQRSVLHPGRNCPPKDGPNKSKYLDRANNLLASLVSGNFEKKQEANKRSSQWNEEESNENFLKNLINEKGKKGRSEKQMKKEERHVSLQNYEEYNSIDDDNYNDYDDDDNDDNYDNYNNDDDDDDDEGLIDNGNLYVYAIEDNVDEESNEKERKKKRTTNRNGPSDNATSRFNIRYYKNIHKIRKGTTRRLKNIINAFMYDPDCMDILVYFTTDAGDLIMNQ